MRIDAACIGHLWIFFDLPVHTPSSNHLKYLKYRSNPSLNKSWRRSPLLSTETALNWNQQCELPKFRHAAHHIIDVPVDYTSKKKPFEKSTAQTVSLAPSGGKGYF